VLAVTGFGKIRDLRGQVTLRVRNSAGTEFISSSS
jgi:hypothetical protein